jgi:hypothetical protein
MNILLLSEFVDSGGAKIGGDYRIDQVNSMTTSPTEPPVTTDDFVKSTRQGMSRYMYRSFYGENDDTNDDVEVPEEDKPKKPKKPNSKPKGKPKTPSPWVKPKERTNFNKLKEASKNSMDSIIEDIFTKKDFDADLVKKYKDSQVRLNGIPDIEVVKTTNPILVRKLDALRGLIDKSSLSGEDKGVVLNYILNIDMSDIPQEYKSELKKKIR